MVIFVSLNIVVFGAFSSPQIIGRCCPRIWHLPSIFQRPLENTQQYRWCIGGSSPHSLSLYPCILYAAIGMAVTGVVTIPAVYCWDSLRFVVSYPRLVSTILERRAWCHWRHHWCSISILLGRYGTHHSPLATLLGAGLGLVGPLQISQLPTILTKVSPAPLSVLSPLPQPGLSKVLFWGGSPDFPQ